MKILFVLIFTFLSGALRSQSNASELPIDSSLAKQLTVSGICLCKTKFSDLQDMDKDLKEVDADDMDTPIKCYAQDSRFINGKGYASGKYPGMIFLKDDAGFISKISLTKNFNGTLPDGTPINMNNVLLKDMLKLYPSMKSLWGSRGCSDYYNFSNDTFLFYVKIDTSRNPQYPIDEAYYMDKPIDGIDIRISCYNIYHKEDGIALFNSDEPLYFYNNIMTNMAFLETLHPSDIALVSVYKDSNAIRIAGKEAIHGAIYVVTKGFARESYWGYFKSRSQAYAQKVPDLKAESYIVYILNDKILEKSPEAELYGINNDNFIGLNVIDHEALKNKYKITGKQIGVFIKIKPKE